MEILHCVPVMKCKEHVVQQILYAHLWTMFEDSVAKSIQKSYLRKSKDILLKYLW